MLRLKSKENVFGVIDLRFNMLYIRMGVYVYIDVFSYGFFFYIFVIVGVSLFLF